jgi:hypothetical protein
VAAESPSSGGGVAEDYYAVLGVVSLIFHFLCIKPILPIFSFSLFYFLYFGIVRKEW